MDAVNEKVRNERQLLNSFTTNSRTDSRASERTLVNMSETELEERSKVKDLEKDGADGTLLQQPVVVTKGHAAPDPFARAKLLMWMVINTLATVFIVSPCSPQPFQLNALKYPFIFDNISPILDLSRYRIMLIPISVHRSSATKPSSRILPLASVRPPLQPSISSSLSQPCIAFPHRDIKCSCQNGLG